MFLSSLHRYHEQLWWSLLHSLVMTHSGPGLWVLSQVLLLLYFKMDNGSNVCGVEFNYNNKEREEENKKEEEEEEKEDDSKSIIGAGPSDMAEVHFNDLLLRKLILGKFEVQSEEGRSVNRCQNLCFS